MTIEKTTERTTRNGWNPSTVDPATAASEDALDQVIEDSFPASDPPSHTPTTGLGAPHGTQQEQPGRRLPTGRQATSVVLAAVAIAGAVAAARWRCHGRAQA